MAPAVVGPPAPPRAFAVVLAVVAVLAVVPGMT